MLSESFVAASSCSPQRTSIQSSLLKDAGIFQHTFQPQPALRSTCKKSAVQTNCLAISQTHFFAAQSEKAVVHVYNREKGNQEATIPFPERIHSIVLAADETVAVLGTASGALIIWEIHTGRSVSTPASHLQAVKALAVDPADNYILSGSADAAVLVWSLIDLLTFSNPGAEGTTHVREARHALSGHDSAVTAVACGHSRSPTNIAISTSTDNTAIAWDYIAGTRLRTIILPSSPLCVTLDPADRAAYVGYDDGSVQRVDFYALKSSGSVTDNLRDSSKRQTPLQPPPESQWSYPAPTHESVDIPAQKTSQTKSQKPDDNVTNPNATLALTLCYTATTLISSHANGSIHAWDVSNGRLDSTLASYTGAPITNIQMLKPTGFPDTPAPRLQQMSIVKPRAYETFASPGLDQPNAAYVLLSYFPTTLAQTLHPQRLRMSAVSRRSSKQSSVHSHTAFEEDLFGVGFSHSTLFKNATTLNERGLKNSKEKNSKGVKARAKTGEATKAEAQKRNGVNGVKRPSSPASTASSEDEDRDDNDKDFLPLPTEDPELVALRKENARLTTADGIRANVQSMLTADYKRVENENAKLRRQLADEKALRAKEQWRKEEEARFSAQQKNDVAKRSKETQTTEDENYWREQRRVLKVRFRKDASMLERTWTAMGGPDPTPFDSAHQQDDVEESEDEDDENESDDVDIDDDEGDGSDEVDMDDGESDVEDEADRET